MMMNGSSPGLEVHDHQEIDERGREDEAEAEPAERRVHALHLAAHGDCASGRELRAKLIHDFCHLVAKRGRDREPCTLA